MSRRPRILLDVDGPLTGGFFDAACRLLRERGYPHASPDTITEWDIMRSYDVSAEIESVVYVLLRQKGVAASFLPNKGAREFVAELQDWADVYAVTAPLGGSPTWTHERYGWLWDNFRIDHKRVIYASDKTIIAGDAIVDDKASTVVSWSAEHPRGLGILWREPHNASATWAGPTAAGYKELRMWLESIRPAPVCGAW